MRGLLFHSLFQMDGHGTYQHMLIYIYINRSRLQLTEPEADGVDSGELEPTPRWTNERIQGQVTLIGPQAHYLMSSLHL